MATNESEKSIGHDEAMALLLSDPEARTEFERLQPRERLIRKIIASRIERGWSQGDLARALGIQRPVISRLESGDVDPKWSTVVKVFDVLGITLTAEFGDTADRLAG